MRTSVWALTREPDSVAFHILYGAGFPFERFRGILHCSACHGEVPRAVPAMEYQGRDTQRDLSGVLGPAKPPRRWKEFQEKEMPTVPTPGTSQQTKGFCTQAFLVHGVSLAELEERLGFRKDRLKLGATILFLEQLPVPEDFELAGYTYFSDGAVRGDKLAPADRAPYRMEALLKSEDKWTDEKLRSHKLRMIGSKIVISGPERLAKVAPILPHSENEKYPAGSGIFQVNIIRSLPFRVKANIAPGQKWTGDFA
jgi:hypothetical protein